MDEISLDPVDWSEYTEFAHIMIEEMTNFVKDIRQEPAWRPIPEEVISFFQKPLPKAGQSIDQIHDEFNRYIKKYPMGSSHPKFWGWVVGTGNPYGALAEFMAAMMNPNLGGGNHSANYVESQVINWSKEMMNYPMESSGIITSGGSMANFIGLAVARNSVFPEVMKHGMGSKRLTIYGSDQTHSSIDKSVQLLGIGLDNFRKIPSEENFTIDIDKLREQIEKDIADGYNPLCIVANVGTTNTGAVDNVKELRKIADNYGIWFHIDGAFGALVKLSKKYSHIVNGIEEADSLAFDFHKWMYIPIEAGCTLIRRKDLHYKSFSLSTDYLVHEKRGVAGGEMWFNDYGLQLSRGFKALKIWISIKKHGIIKYGKLIEQNIEQAKYLEKMVNEQKGLETVSPASLCVYNFRFVGDGMVENDHLDELNKEIVLEIQEKGLGIPSLSKVNGKQTIRLAITNHRSKKSDFEELVQNVHSIGWKLLKKTRES